MRKSLNKNTGISSSSRRGGAPKAVRCRPAPRSPGRRNLHPAAWPPEPEEVTAAARMITKDFTLPSEEELTVQEINISTPSLRAAAFHLGKTCEAQNNEYMLCRKEENDPRKCLAEGKEVTACSLNFFRKLKKACLEEFSQYANCLDKSSRDMEYRLCRNTQAIYDKCVLDNIGVERPDFGYFCEPKIVDSKRPKPPAPDPIEFPDTPLPLPDEPVRGEARYGTRRHWFQ